MGDQSMTIEDSGQPSSELTITEHELVECKRVNATGRPPVVFVHGLWLLPNSWERWATLFEENGYAALTPGWPDDPETAERRRLIRKCSPANRSGRWPTISRPSSGPGPKASRHLAFIRWVADPNPRRTRPGRCVGGH
jgi:hypothetical protein